MPTILSAILPVFALIAAGFGFGRWRRIDAAGIAVLNGFTVWLALPALLFRVLAAGDWRMLDQPGFLLAFSAGLIATFALGLVLLAPSPGAAEPLADRALAALTGAYANTAFLGIPLAGGLLGPVGAAAAVIASLVTVSGLFALALLLVEIGKAGGGGALRASRTVIAALARNPLVLSPLAGAAWALSGLALPGAAARFLDLLAAAASPCALVTIGAFVALPGPPARAGPLARVVLLKLAVQPALTLAAAVWLVPALGLGLSRDWRAAAILIAALPTGTGPFMLSELYGREVGLAARAVLVSTIVALPSIAVLALVLLP